jgi:hypothetical protein
MVDQPAPSHRERWLHVVREEGADSAPAADLDQDPAEPARPRLPTVFTRTPPTATGGPAVSGPDVRTMPPRPGPDGPTAPHGPPRSPQPQPEGSAPATAPWTGNGSPVRVDGWTAPDGNRDVGLPQADGSAATERWNTSAGLPQANGSVTERRDTSSGSPQADGSAATERRNTSAGSPPRIDGRSVTAGPPRPHRDGWAPPVAPRAESAHLDGWAGPAGARGGVIAGAAVRGMEAEPAARGWVIVRPAVPARWGRRVGWGWAAAAVATAAAALVDRLVGGLDGRPAIFLLVVLALPFWDRLPTRVTARLAELAAVVAGLAVVWLALAALRPEGWWRAEVAYGLACGIAGTAHALASRRRTVER